MLSSTKKSRKGNATNTLQKIPFAAHISLEWYHQGKWNPPKIYDICLQRKLVRPFRNGQERKCNNTFLDFKVYFPLHTCINFVTKGWRKTLEQTKQNRVTQINSSFNWFKKEGVIRKKVGLMNTQNSFAYIFGYKTKETLRSGSDVAKTKS